mmetsp:Transcript_6028/g.9411  ORF Transcript_6028/g.9411 Transcript_6028/m.9411 type:complete len:93 (-) Transcript_6028:205-483(-)
MVCALLVDFLKKIEFLYQPINFETSHHINLANAFSSDVSGYPLQIQHYAIRFLETKPYSELGKSESFCAMSSNNSQQNNTVRGGTRKAFPRM